VCWGHVHPLLLLLLLPHRAVSVLTFELMLSSCELKSTVARVATWKDHKLHVRTLQLHDYCDVQVHVEGERGDRNFLLIWTSLRHAISPTPPPPTHTHTHTRTRTHPHVQLYAAEPEDDGGNGSRVDDQGTPCVQNYPRSCDGHLGRH
jgi:hypothetical protein